MLNTSNPLCLFQPPLLPHAGVLPGSSSGDAPPLLGVTNHAKPPSSSSSSSSSSSPSPPFSSPLRVAGDPIDVFVASDSLYLKHQLTERLEGRFGVRFAYFETTESRFTTFLTKVNRAPISPPCPTHTSSISTRCT